MNELARKSEAYRRLKSLTGFLFIAWLVTIAMLAVVVHDYRHLDTTVAQCYGTADAAYWFADSLIADIEGDLTTADRSLASSEKALAALGDESIIDAMQQCDDLFLGPSQMVTH